MAGGLDQGSSAKSMPGLCAALPHNARSHDKSTRDARAAAAERAEQFALPRRDPHPCGLPGRHDRQPQLAAMPTAAFKGRPQLRASSVCVQNEYIRAQQAHT